MKNIQSVKNKAQVNPEKKLNVPLKQIPKIDK